MNTSILYTSAASELGPTDTLVLKRAEFALCSLYFERNATLMEIDR